MKTTLKRKPRGQVYFLSLVLILLIFLSAEARADLYYFYALTSDPDDLAAGLSVEVTYTAPELGETYGITGFEFYNLSTESAITEIYFDDGSLIELAEIINGEGANFVPVGVTPPVLPAGEILIPPFEATVAFSAESDPENPVWGIGGDPYDGEWARVEIYSTADIWAAIDLGFTDPADDNSLRVGIHVKGLNDGGSESFLMIPYPGFTPQVVPLPGAVLLGMLGLSVAGIKLRKYA